MERLVPSSEVLLTRALNATRINYFPTYVGLRLIGTQLPAGDSGLLEQLVARRLNSSDDWRFRRFQLYKSSVSIRGEISHEYRDALTPSPFTAVAEALILAMLARDPEFAVPSRAFSYRWPRSPYAGGSYEFFSEGYHARNNEIAASMHGDSVAVVCDIQRFYPSVKSEHIMEALGTRLRRSASGLRDCAEEVLHFFEKLISAGGGGIPIGPSAAHVLGHVVLDGVDAELTRKFGNAYYRYVDDIVVVCSRDDAKAVQRLIAAVVKSHGLEINSTKTAVLTQKEWDRELMRPDIGSDDSFRVLIRDLVVYLAFHPDRADSLRAGFAERGLSVPVKRLLALSSYSRFRYFIRRSRTLEAFRRSMYAFLATNDAFFARASQLKTHYEATFLAETRAEPSAEGHTRRWKLQRIRRLTNVMFYLSSFAEWDERRAELEPFPELLEQRALANALRTGSVLDVLPFFGRGPAAFAELWSETSDHPATFEWPRTGLVGAEVESLLMLQMYGVITLKPEQLHLRTDYQRLLGIAAAERVAQRSHPDLTYEDELESLRLGKTNRELAELSRTRYSLTELAPLDALGLLATQYVS